MAISKIVLTFAVHQTLWRSLSTYLKNPKADLIVRLPDNDNGQQHLHLLPKWLLFVIFLLPMRIRRTLFYDIITDSTLTRAVAMALFVKYKIKSSAVNKFSYNKLHRLTGLHINTCRKYVRALQRMNLVRFDGKQHDTLVFCALHSRHKKNNIDIGEIIIPRIGKIAYQLLAIFNTDIIRHKLFAEHTISTALDGHTSRQVKAARRKARKYGYGEKFIERGLSYKGIAKKLKCGLQKAQSIIEFCVKHGYLVKHRNFIQIYNQNAQTVYSLFPERYTFATKNNLYIVNANTYTLGPLAHVEMVG